MAVVTAAHSVASLESLMVALRVANLDEPKVDWKVALMAESSDA